MEIAKVLIEIKSNNLDYPFDYYIPNGDLVEPGKRVLVRFGYQTLIGFVIQVYQYPGTIEDFNNSNKFKINPILKVIDEEPILNDELIELGKRLSENYFTSQIAFYQAMLPPSLKPLSSKKVGIKYRKVLVAKDLTVDLTLKQEEVYNYILENPRLEKKDIPFGESVIKTLIKKDVIEVINEEVYRTNFKSDYLEKTFELNEEQKNAIDIISTKSGTFLLFGVTGSGKTEVYISLIQKTIEEGKSVIILLPEISLTPQMIKVYQTRLNCDIAVLHSGLSSGERYDEYRRISRKEVSVVLGTRSAIFAPLVNIGLIIIDEEHSATYKQDTNPRYHARDVAILRATKYNAKIILGSATPSLESYARAIKGVYTLVELKYKVNKSLPDTIMVDMNEEAQRGNYSLFSDLLLKEIRTKISNGEQVMLLLNRRGYSSYVFCQMCNNPISCPNCSISLTYHKEENTLNCHHCGYYQDMPKVCPVCSSKKIRYYGIGIQKVEETIHKLIPEAIVLRMDSDNVNYKNAHQELLSDFEQGKSNILLGTQMISKGLNFPNVTLVGIINADQGLNINTFRAAETTFQLLAQIIGRVSRFEKKGTAIIQTYKPNNYVIKYSLTENYLEFFKKEMAIRKLRKYPPYNNMINYILKGKNKGELYRIAEEIKNYLVSQKLDIEIKGPAAPYIAKIDENYIVKLLIKYKYIETIRGFIQKITKEKESSSIQITIDIDPYTES